MDLHRSGLNLVTPAILRNLSHSDRLESDKLLIRNPNSVYSSFRDGESIRDGLAKSVLFPKTATNLIGVGEEAGELETTLNKLSTYYKRQIDYTLANLSKSIEPILLFVVFGMVLALALAVFLPMWKMNSIMKR